MCRKWKDNGIIKKGRFLYIKVILLIVFSALEAEDIMMILFGIPKIQLMYAMLLWLICDMLFYSDMLLPYFRMKYGNSTSKAWDVYMVCKIQRYVLHDFMFI